MTAETISPKDAAAQPSDSVTAAAMARLNAYLKSQQLDPAGELIARDAALVFFRWGATWAIRMSTSLSTQLAQPDLRDGMRALVDLLSRAEGVE